MKRREFLRVSAAAGVIAATGQVGSFIQAAENQPR